MRCKHWFSEADISILQEKRKVFVVYFDFKKIFKNLIQNVGNNIKNKGVTVNT